MSHLRCLLLNLLLLFIYGVKFVTILVLYYYSIKGVTVVIPVSKLYWWKLVNIILYHYIYVLFNQIHNADSITSKEQSYYKKSVKLWE